MCGGETPAIFFLSCFFLCPAKETLFAFFLVLCLTFFHNSLYVRRGNARDFFLACFFVCPAKEIVFAERDCVCLVFSVFQYPAWFFTYFSLFDLLHNYFSVLCLISFTILCIWRGETPAIFFACFFRMFGERHCVCLILLCFPIIF